MYKEISAGYGRIEGSKRISQKKSKQEEDAKLYGELWDFNF